MVLLNKTEYNQYLSLNNMDYEMQNTLLENHILVDETFDEVNFLMYCHNITKYSHDALHLVLATTMECNFGCPYCYENRRKGKMSLQVQEAIINFIHKNLEKGIKLLDITWYGGEPLLYPEIIKNMSEKIHTLVDKYSCELNMYMVTNGYLLTPELVEMLDLIGVVKIQITLDG